MAALIIISASINAIIIDSIETNLARNVKNLRREIDTESTTLWNATVELKGAGSPEAPIPVSIHLYKQHKRVRIQILTHEITKDKAEKVEDLICKALNAQIISRHYPEHDAHPLNKQHIHPATPQIELKSQSQKKQKLG
jgi:hypothetical protein